MADRAFDENIRRRCLAGEGVNDIARSLGISPVKVSQARDRAHLHALRMENDLYAFLLEAAAALGENETRAIRTYLVLQRAHVNSLEQVLGMTETEMLKLRDVGEVATNFVARAIERIDNRTTE